MYDLRKDGFYMGIAILYSNGCPKCRVLESKLNAKGIAFEKSEDFSKLIEQEKQSLPVLEVSDKFMDFPEANAWVNDYVEGKISNGENSESSVEIVDDDRVQPV